MPILHALLKLDIYYGRTEVKIMKEENYFEKKLEMSKDNLAYSKSELESVDIQIKVLKKRFEYDLEIYNKKVIRLQEIGKNMESRIESLQKKLDQGYTCIDMKTGKGYKSLDARHKAHLSELTKEAEARYKERDKAYKLKKKRKEIPKPVVEPPIGEIIESQKERELRLLKEKLERLEAQRKELELEKEEFIEDVIEEAIETIEEVIEDTIEEVLEIKEEELEIPNALGPIDETLAYKDSEWLLTIHQDWILEYQKEGDGKAIWQGRITNGFRAWLKFKGYKIGE